MYPESVEDLPTDFKYRITELNECCQNIDLTDYIPDFNWAYNLVKEQESFQDSSEENNAILEIYKMELADQARRIVSHLKGSIEPVLSSIRIQIENEAFKLLTQLREYQFKHKCVERSKKFSNILQPIPKQASELAFFALEAVDTLTQYHIMDTLRLDDFISQFCTLGGIEDYPNYFKNYAQFIYQKFSLVIDQQPPLVLNVSRAKPISVRFFHLWKTQRTTTTSEIFNLNTYMVRDDIKNKIEKTGIIPETITSITYPNHRTTARRRNQITGKINLIGTGGNCQGIHPSDDDNSPTPKRQRLQQTEEPVVSSPGFPVVQIISRWNRSQNCYCFDRRLFVKEKPTGGDDTVKDKMYLLFAMDVEVRGRKFQVWTFSLPFCVTTNASQYERAWKAMAWYNAVFKPTQFGFFGPDFQENNIASWDDVKEIFKVTCLHLTDKSLSDKQINFLEKKLRKSISDKESKNDNTGIKKDIFFQSSFWSYFYGALSVVQKDSNIKMQPWNWIWRAGHLEGFISFDDACTELRSAPRYSFMGRFSEECIGGITFVFNGDETQSDPLRLPPLPVRHFKSLQETTDEVLKQLEVKSNYTDVLQFVHPGGTGVKDVFKIFYQQSSLHKGMNSESLVSKGYCRIFREIVRTTSSLRRILLSCVSSQGRSVDLSYQRLVE